jgi:hypothetical protein
VFDVNDCDDVAFEFHDDKSHLHNVHDVVDGLVDDYRAIDIDDHDFGAVVNHHDVNDTDVDNYDDVNHTDIYDDDYDGLR